MDRKEMAAVMMADGPWEFRPRGHGYAWQDCKGEPSCWNWPDYEYRVKPQPKVIWVNESTNGIHVGYNSQQLARDYRDYGVQGPTRTAVRYVEAPEESA